MSSNVRIVAELDGHRLEIRFGVPARFEGSCSCGAFTMRDPDPRRVFYAWRGEHLGKPVERGA